MLCHAQAAKSLGQTLRAFQPTIKEVVEVSQEIKGTLEQVRLLTGTVLVQQQDRGKGNRLHSSSLVGACFRWLAQQRAGSITTACTSLSLPGAVHPGWRPGRRGGLLVDVEFFQCFSPFTQWPNGLKQDS